MLVLSRREAESVRFPGLGITIKVLVVKGKTTRLGIDAPTEINVLRGELDGSQNDFAVKPTVSHEVRNRLKSLRSALRSAEELVIAEEPEKAANALYKALIEIENPDCESSVEPTAIDA